MFASVVKQMRDKHQQEVAAAELKKKQRERQRKKELKRALAEANGQTVTWDVMDPRNQSTIRVEMQISEMAILIDGNQVETEGQFTEGGNRFLFQVAGQRATVDVPAAVSQINEDEEPQTPVDKASIKMRINGVEIPHKKKKSSSNAATSGQTQSRSDRKSNEIV